MEMSWAKGLNWLLISVSILCCSTEAASDVTKKRMARSGSITVENKCVLGTEALVAHVLLPVHYSASSLGAVTFKHILQFWCDSEMNGCYGIQLRIDQLEKKKPIRWDDLDRLNNIKGVRKSSTEVQLSWGMGSMKVSIDFQTGTVTYSEAIGLTKARGEARCQVDDIRTCANDDGCLPQWQCYSERCILREQYR